MAGGFSDGAWRRKPATSRRNVRVLLLVLGLAIAGLLAGPLSSAMQSGLSPTTSPARVTESGLTSWNPHVSCSADLVTIRDVLGPAYPTQTVNGSRYQTNSTAGGIPQERALSPPCTITNKTGTVLSPFVQINSVSLYGYGVKTTDCSAWYSKQNGGSRYPNNQTFCSNAGQIITIGTTRGYMKIEIDRDWLGKGYCGVGVPYCDNATLGQYQSNGSISLDFQGFVFWEGPYHWELHPLTGWRLSAPPAPPSAPQNLAATGGNAQVTLTWQAPASDGGSPITNYKIYRGVAPGSEALLTTVGNVLTYTDSAVTYVLLSGVRGQQPGRGGQIERSLGHSEHASASAHASVGADEPRGHRRECASGSGLAGTQFKRRLADHELPDLSGYVVQRRDAAGDDRQCAHVHRHRGDERRDVLLSGLGRERGRGGPAVERGLRRSFAAAASASGL